MIKKRIVESAEKIVSATSGPRLMNNMELEDWSKEPNQTKCFACDGPIKKETKLESGSRFDHIAVKVTWSVCQSKECGESTVWGVHAWNNEKRLALLLVHEKKEHFTEKELMFIRKIIGISEDEYNKIVKDLEEWRGTP